MFTVCSNDATGPDTELSVRGTMGRATGRAETFVNEQEIAKGIIDRVLWSRRQWKEHSSQTIAGAIQRVTQEHAEGLVSMAAHHFATPLDATQTIRVCAGSSDQQHRFRRDENSTERWTGVSLVHAHTG